MGVGGWDIGWKMQLQRICEEGFVLGTTRDITGAQSEPLLELVLILGRGRLIKASLVFPMTLSCELSLPRAVSHPVLPVA